MNRRRFLQSTAVAAAASLAFPHILSAADPSRRVRVGIMGLNSRGMAHLEGFLAVDQVEITHLCDVDVRTLDKAAAVLERRQRPRPLLVRDVRKMLEDPALDAISIAAPNHWHAPATILACAAGKHVYVEKPGSHNGYEADFMVRAANHHKRVVQMGNQRRSWPWVVEAIQRLHAGEIGPVRFARAWYNANRPTIGRGKPAPVPSWLDYGLWQGPAPERPFLDNIVHYNWHWRWHWGGGELANNGIHALDLARWGLQVDSPTRVACIGGRYHFSDDQETPDTCVTNFDFAGAKGISWDCHSCHPHGFHGEGFGVQFYGDGGSLVIAGNSARILDLKQKPVREIQGKWDDKTHFANFIDAIRNGTTLTAPIADGQKSTLLCHLGNIAYRTRSELAVSPDGKILNNRAATRFWRRDYRPGWAPRLA